MGTYKVLDLFAGAGGLSLGFSQTSRFETVMAIEINKNAAETYKQNHNIEVIAEDIRTIDFKDYKKYPQLNDISVVIGGPPCQGFSNANRQKSELFSNNNLLVKEFVRVIKEVKPDGFVMENVKTISSDKHKFFVTTGERAELELIGIQIKDEDLFLGNTKTVNEILVDLYNRRKIISTFANPNLIAKLKSLVRYSKKHNEINGFINKNYSLLSKSIQEWDKLFETYGNENLKEIIMNFKSSLMSLLNQQHAELNLSTLAKQIIEIHNITLIFNEISQKKIECSMAFTKEDKGIFVKGYTFTVIDYLFNIFKSLDYKLDKGVLNAAHYGVPQERNRYFIIGHKKAQPKLPNPILSRKEFFNIGEAIKDIAQLHPRFKTTDDMPIKKNNSFNHPLSIYLNANIEILPNHVVTQSTDTALKRFKNLGPGQNFHDLDESLKTTYADTKRTQNTIYKRLDYNEVSNTVVNVRKSMWIHPVEDRAISIREAARLQSFPDDYIFIGTKDSQYQQVGNAVPPLLGRAVAEQLLTCFNDKPTKSLSGILNKEKRNSSLNQ
ncbi:DNA cytosine methyltransferase [Pullulanibacillus sp. KACC 23026]|uniref:DNA cytosine methyltransferase n=1 Tax=Pullulanibacillus sp. KACC 23026 TaxID=3028315 RepID=UPI0023B0591F|nr:DNA cytosine methyltransferase [Pullulanibacillus sp. KACC 23026]WEG11145.1 DNA cytosine methyltransferase [Pullulanibacillus sp. KACC 23026]